MPLPSTGRRGSLRVRRGRVNAEFVSGLRHGSCKSPNKPYYSVTYAILTTNDAQVKKTNLLLLAVLVSLLYAPAASGQNQTLPQVAGPDVESFVDELCDTQFQLPKTRVHKNRYLESVRPIAEAVRAVVVKDAEGLEKLRSQYPDYNDDALIKKYTGLAAATLVSKCANVREQMYGSLGAEPQPNPSLLFIRDKIEAAFESADEYDSMTSQQRETFSTSVDEWSIPFVGSDLQRRAEYLVYMLESSEQYRTFMLRMDAERSLDPETLVNSDDHEIKSFLDAAAAASDANSLAGSAEIWEQIIRVAESDGYTVFTHAVSEMSDKIGFVSDLQTWYAGTEIVFILFVDKMAKARPFLELGNGSGAQRRSTTFFQRMSQFEDHKYKIYSGKFTIPKTGEMWLAVGNSGWIIDGRLVGLEK